MKGILICLILSVILGFHKAQSQSKAPVRVYLEHFKFQEEHQLSIRVLTKNDRRYRPAEGVEVKLYASKISPRNLLGSLVSTEDGTNTYTFSKEQNEIANNTMAATYYGVIHENDTVQNKEVDITIKDVNLEVRYFGDSVWRKQIYVHVSETDSAGNDIPQKKVDINILVDRPLSPLPIRDVFSTDDEEGNMSTDAEGNIYMNFPDDLPGDEDGNLKILIKIVEDDDYGTVEVADIKQWGIPTIINDLTLKRSLWASSANAPIPLLIFVISLIVAVWWVIFYIVYKLFHIRKIGRG
jgi:hypothetical protein